MSKPEPQHWPTERMILEGHAEWATHEDFEGVGDDILLKIAEICEVPDTQPDECIPCWAYAEYMERQQNRLTEMAPDMPEPETLFETDGDAEYPVKEEDSSKSDEESSFTDRPVFAQQARHADPVMEVHRTVKYLDGLLEEVLNGPPIPPKDVTVAELAMLVIAADKYIRMTEAQGVELASNQQQVLDATKELVARLRS